ncbi:MULTISPECIES: orotate phosphoribosyltransferase [Lactobacillus]|uniref:Orotate phosphoribosyltransferase n=1 Tax=Lactobacillus apis TaxID=303541 RepID=A0A0F4LS43_9LACO|nr:MULTISPECIES: orotate phosphoribosyltransferase [Lactobacillus]AWM73890.1 orotate phosphoribosyltransferase [Lactobacillus apis]KJY61597.1 Orotate phosphoribosyltransferase [Lactobacillus apis]MBC6361140.1 orotate phosphoribosyltransferase [Lactobacillus apis]MBH9985638.1 orotate phosphoribosyltransferase [Lactobacillus sp. M0390]MBI0092684.1 orotate phosphoribosyltransferase [Lactobacillus sp. M0403]
MYQDQIINKLVEEKIITISPDKPYTYASGMLSPIYTDLRLTVSYPDLRDWIATDLAALIKEKYPNVSVIGGVATAGIPHAAWVATKLGLPMIYVRPKPKDHGKGRQIEGRFTENDQIVLIDDLITTGGSVINAVKATENEGGNVIGVGSIFTYYLSDTKKNFADAGVDFSPLLTYPQLLQKEKEMNYISSDEYEALKTWHEDPWEWGKKFQ